MVKTAIIDFVAGSIGGTACVYVGQPLDTIKVKMQTHPNLYKSTTSCLIDTFRKEGSRGFYAGSTPAIAANVGGNAFLFLFYGRCRNVVEYMTGKTEQELTVFDGACAGSLASFFGAFTLCPPELLKCRLQTLREQHGKLKISIVDLMKTVMKEDGILGFFRGLTPLLLREVPANFFFFGGYEGTKSLLLRTDEERSNPAGWKIILAGGMGGASFWLSIYPVDVIKSKLQVASGDSKSFLGTAKIMYKREGLGSFYKGLTPTLLRSFPANAALFWAYEFSKDIMYKYT